MSKTALITGASSGIGQELARYHASRGGDLIVTARREAELRALKDELEAKHGISVHVFVADLASEEGADRLYDAISEAGHTVDILINNAGFGGQGIHTHRDLETEKAMINLNVKALVTLTHRFGADMETRGKGRILNVSSTAAHMPGPLQAVYFATKAFVSSFSQSVDHELRPGGVTCTCLEPGFVPTDFVRAAGLEGTRLSKLKGKSPASVAKHGYDAMMAGKLRTINEFPLSILLNWILPFAPRRLMLKVMQMLQSK